MDRLLRTSEEIRQTVAPSVWLWLAGGTMQTSSYMPLELGERSPALLRAA